jgi:alkylation response protein AidB-like acyl-CoA dehydrogenase
MDLAFTSQEQAFRAEVREFVRAALPAEIRRKGQSGEALTKDEYIAWQRALHARGWMAPAWPREYGGSGWTVVERHIFEEELALGWAPRQIPFGVSMVAPVIVRFGDERQKAYYLPRILDSTDWWCQGYSEPGSGSDLASLSTRAERDGEFYVVDGAKTWITLAQYANMIFCLVRTGRGERKQDGISFLLVDMTSPGVTVRPIVTIDGGREINEVLFERVRVPVANLVGREGEGWAAAKFLLEHERNGTAGVAGSRQLLDRLKAFAAQQCVAGGGSLLDAPEFADKIASVEIELTALSYAQLRALAAESSGDSPGPESSFIKIVGTEIQQRITELMVEAAGYGALAPGNGSAAWYFNFRKVSIYAGSNEIQRNIIAKRILGL